jgi:membrane-bound lytic murein transglycosylase F
MLTRNTPTTYYFEGDNEAGLDYELARAFAEQHGMTLRVKVAFSLPELFAMLARGEGHFAAAGLTQSAQRDKQFQASLPYLRQQALVAYKSGKLRPRSLPQLVDRDLVVVAGSAHTELLEGLQVELPQLSWREIHAVDSLELMQLITEEKAELAVVIP